MLQGAVAQPFGIALAGLGQIDDLPRQHIVGEISAVSEPKCDQAHLECDAHDPERLRVELLTVYVRPDWHGRLWAETAARRRSALGTFSVSESVAMWKISIFTGIALAVVVMAGLVLIISMDPGCVGAFVYEFDFKPAHCEH